MNHKKIEIKIAGSVPLMIEPFSFTSTGNIKYGMHIDNSKHKFAKSERWLHCGGVISDKMILKLIFYLVLHLITKPFLILYYNLKYRIIYRVNHGIN